MKDFKNSIVVFSDGACSGNPGKGGWGSIIARPNGTIDELGKGAPDTTNNRMELIATISALEFIANESGPVEVFTDSVYVIRGITQWIWGWKKRGWKTAAGEDVANKDLWEWFSKVVSARPSSSPINWNYVRGHTGVAGNERCDEIAVQLSKGKSPKLYSGSLLKYDVAIYDIPDDTSLPEIKERTAKAKALSYLSVVNGKVQRHENWADCESVVKGRSGAKFKKATSEADEETILASWGYDLTDIQD
jgi:ribonuclease HI